MNQVVLVGRLTKAPELRYTDNQTAVCTFTLAVDRPFKNGDERKADFIRIQVWGKQAENCARFLAKGRQAAVEGSIQTDSYQNRNGDRVYMTQVNARNVEFLGGKEKEREEFKEETALPAEGIPAEFEAIDDEDIPF